MLSANVVLWSALTLTQFAFDIPVRPKSLNPGYGCLGAVILAGCRLSDVQVQTSRNISALLKKPKAPSIETPLMI